VRADRLISLVLLLQARGRTTARSLASELQVSVRTIYRDLEALSAAGVPVLAESGPGGGCQLLDGYRFPLRGLRPEEAEALLILGVPSAIRELGLERAAVAAQRQIRITSGLGGPRAGDGPAGEPGAAALVHLDMPAWFRGDEEVPYLTVLAEALRRGRQVALGYPRGTDQAGDGGLGPHGAGRADAETVRRGDGGPGQRAQGCADPVPVRPGDSGPGPASPRVVGPLGLVNKAGRWYLAAASGRRVVVFRVGRISSARVLDQPFDRPADFNLAEFWDRWSAEFTRSRPRLPVRLRASPEALAVFGEVFGDAVRPALDAALPPDGQGWQVVTLSFEHERAAAQRLAGFGGRVEVLAPPSVRELLLAAAQEILDRYRS
jgi:predicted DNA-binding transcriptional regulator YafY